MNKVSSAPTPSSAPVGAASNSASNNANDNGYRLPENNTLQHAAK